MASLDVFEGPLENEGPFDLASEFNHALAICLNAVYANQVVVTSQESIATEQFMFKASLAHHAAQSSYICVAEALFGETGKMFRNLLTGMCLAFDDAKVIYEHKMPKSFKLMTEPDDQMTIFPNATPVEKSWEKLLDSGVVEALSEALDARHSIKLINVNDLTKAIREFQNAVDKIHSEMGKVKQAAFHAEKNFLALQMKMVPMEFAQGGFPVASSYQDSGKILLKKFPGLSEQVKFPCRCISFSVNSVHNVIMHLNDAPGHGTVNAKTGKYKEDAWTREQIADWTETLDVNLEMKED